MRKYTKIYMDYFGYDVNSFISCEMCGLKAVDIHHIEAKGLGGNPSNDKDTIENLMALCRQCHIDFGDKKQHKEMLKVVHKVKMNECK